MKTPRLNHSLTLETPARASDGAGGFSEVWTPLGVLWAQLIPRTGREGAQGPTAVSRTAYKIIVRSAPVGHSQRPVAEQRFRDGERLFRIAAVTEHDVGCHYLACYAEEEVAT